MTEEQEKYIIEKYSFFWNGVCMLSFTWKASKMHPSQKMFAKYINVYKKLSDIKEKEIIPQLIKNKSYTNFRKYISILSPVYEYLSCNKVYREHIKALRQILYFTELKVPFESFEKYASFYFTISCGLDFNLSDMEKNINTIIDDAILVYEIVRPDIIYNACLTKDMVLLKDNFNRINQILLKYDKYVYYYVRNKSVYNFINPTKIKQFKYLIELLVRNKYVFFNKKKNNYGVFINEEVISKSLFLISCVPFMQELHFYNSKIFHNRACTFFHIQGINLNKIRKCPRKLQLIFDAVRKYDNEITNQQETNK